MGRTCALNRKRAQCCSLKSFCDEIGTVQFKLAFPINAEAQSAQRGTERKRLRNSSANPAFLGVLCVYSVAGSEPLPLFVEAFGGNRKRRAEFLGEEGDFIFLHHPAEHFALLARFRRG